MTLQRLGRSTLLTVALLLVVIQWSNSRAYAASDDNVAPPGFVSLFNGRDFTGWKVPDGDGGHWKVINGVIDPRPQFE